MISGSLTRQRAISSRRRSPPESVAAFDLTNVLDVELLQQLLTSLPTSPTAYAQQFQHAEDVLLDGQFLENTGFLRQIPHAPSRPTVHGPGGDVESREEDGAGIGFQHPADHAETSRLAGAVGSQQSDDLTLPHVQIHAIDHSSAAERFYQTFGFQDVSLCRSSMTCARAHACAVVQISNQWISRIRFTLGRYGMGRYQGCGQ